MNLKKKKLNLRVTTVFILNFNFYYPLRQPFTNNNNNDKKNKKLILSTTF